MPQAVIDLLKKGLEANKKDKFRQANLVTLPGQGRLIVTGDIHGHRRNFERIVTFADLKNNPNTHLVLQEIIHGGPQDSTGACLSYKLLFDVVRYKIEFTDQVHIIMGNHDTAFISNSKVLKDGKEMNRAMLSAIEREFGTKAENVKLAISQFLFSQPLAVRCENKIWISHSLPGDRYFAKFDPKIIERELKINDVVKPGAAYIITWGRRMSQSVIDKLAKSWDVDIFIVGHQPQKQGWAKAGDNLVIIASDHNHGCLLPIDLAKAYNVHQLIEAVVPLASLA